VVTCKIKHFYNILRPRHSRGKSAVLKHLCKCFILHVTTVYDVDCASCFSDIVSLEVCITIEALNRLHDDDDDDDDDKEKSAHWQRRACLLKAHVHLHVVVVSKFLYFRVVYLPIEQSLKV